MSLPFDIDPHQKALGLLVLQSDETIEQDFRRIFGPDTLIYVSRVPCATEVSRDTLQQMAETLPPAAALFPQGARLSAIGYGCTSGTAQIGATKISELVCSTAATDQVTQPVSALIAACKVLGVRRLGFLSPYVQDVSSHLIKTLADNGIECPVFGSFDEGRETIVAHIAPDSTYQAAATLAKQGGIDALFLSCTNLRTLDVIEGLEQDTRLPVLSSNQALAWHMARLTGTKLPANSFGSLFRAEIEGNKMSR